MSQVTWDCNKDTRVAQRQSDGLNQGAGASVALPFGYYQGYIYRAYLDFGHNISSLNVIDKAVLWLRTSDQYYVAFGSDPDLNVARLTEWSEGEGSSTSLSTGNATVYGDAPYDATPIIQKDVTTAINTWVSIDITALIQEAKTSGFYGLMLSSTGTGSSDVGEFWSREKGSSYRPYIVVDYTNNRAPNAPTLTNPASGYKYSSTTTAASLTATASDPDAGDSVSKYHLQISTNSGFTALVYNGDNQTSGISGMNISRSTSGLVTLAPGTYWWRMYTYDAAGLKSPVSAVRTFIINALPTVTNANMPYAAAPHVAPIHNMADKVTTLTPKPQFTFKPTAGDGEAITGYQIEISGGGLPAPLTDTVTGSWASGTSITHKHTGAVPVVNGVYTGAVRIRVRDAFEGYGIWSSVVTFYVKYGQAVYQFNIPGSTNVGVTGAGATLLYRTATGVNGAGAGPWLASSPTTIAAYLNVMVRTGTSGSAPTQPKLTSLSVTYYAAGGETLPYNWSLSGTNWSMDSSLHRYGTKSLRLDPSGALYKLAYQTINVDGDTDYVATAWVHVDGVTPGFEQVYIQASNSDNTAEYARMSALAEGWQRVVLPFHTDPGETQARIYLVVAPAIVAPAIIHFDGVSINHGLVAPKWEPSLQSPNSQQYVDAVGAKWRTGASSFIEIGAASYGISFNGDVTLSRDAVGRLKLWTPLGATAPRIGLTFDNGHAATSYGYFIWNEGDTVARAALGKHNLGQGAIHFGPGNAATDIILFRDAANSLGFAGSGTFAMRLFASTSAQYLQMFSGGTTANGMLIEHGLSAAAQSRLMAYDSSGNSREVLRWDGTTAGRIGFYGAATGGSGNLVSGRQTVTGSRGANAALTSLLTALDNLGLIANSST